MKTHVLAPRLCPACGTPLDAATGLDASRDEPPRPGDATVCIECEEVLVFDEDQRLRIPRALERAVVESDPQLQLVRRMVRYIKGQQPGGSMRPKEGPMTRH